jgi:hypothetical protein
MANDSEHFKDHSELAKLGAYPVTGNRWKKGAEEFLPLYEGKIVQSYDHRASDIVIAENNVFRPGQGARIHEDLHKDPNRGPVPRYYVDANVTPWTWPTDWCLAVKDVTSVTNARTFIAAMIPMAAAGHTLPLIIPAKDEDVVTRKRSYVCAAPLLVANFNSIVLDYLARQKVHGNHLAWYLIEQLPTLGQESYSTAFGKKNAADIVRENVLALTYTAHDMAPFARDLGYVDESGTVQPPFIWDEEDRAHRRAKLDALYFHLYGITDHTDVSYIFSTFPIVEREDNESWGRYLSRDLTLAYMNALAAGDPDIRIVLPSA